MVTPTPHNILLIIACVLFLMNACRFKTPVSLTSLGLFCLAASMLVP